MNINRRNFIGLNNLSIFRLGIFWTMLWLVVVSWGMVPAQVVQSSSSIRGTLRDQSGGVIPGVTVHLISTDNGTTRSFISDDSGHFLFTNLLPGNYMLRADLEGFKPVEMRGIKLHAGEDLVLGGWKNASVEPPKPSNPSPPPNPSQPAPSQQPLNPPPMVPPAQSANPPQPMTAFDPRSVALKGKDKGQTISPYFFVKSNDPLVDQLPLKSTVVRVNIVGVIADVTVTQTYTNEGTRPLEAIYVFPGSTRAAVYGMKMTIGERHIEAKVRERFQARQEYEQAKREGRSASLLEQERPNVFTMNVANILPGDVIAVELCYTELLVPTDGVYEFVYPTVVGPRYSNKTEATAQENDKFLQSGYTHEGELPTSRFDITVSIAAGLPIQTIVCPTHAVTVEQEDPAQAIIRLDESETFGGNRDYILKYCLSGFEIQSGLLAYQGADENFFLLMVQPPKKVSLEEVLPREYIFIVDVSGSMNGFPLGISKTLLCHLVGSLRPTDRFNVVLFAGGSSIMATASVPATPENIGRAIHLINKEQGGGGTELLPALKEALDLPKSTGFSRTVVIATDGYVDVEKEAFDLVRSHLGEANLFAFGIGTSVNRFLIEGLARAGQGEPFIAINKRQARHEAARFKDYVLSPLLTGIRVDYRGLRIHDVEPPAVGDLLADRPLIIFGKWDPPLRGVITVSGDTPQGPYSQDFDLSQVQPDLSYSALRQLWARQRIANLGDYTKLSQGDNLAREITELGMRYNLMTDYTSFVAVDTLVRNRGGQQKKIAQPLPLPEGVSNQAVGAGQTTNYSTSPSGSPGGLTMGVSTVTTEVEVKADVAMVSSTTSQIDAVTDEKRITDLPLNGRNPMDLVYLVPGVTRGAAGASANGTRSRGDNYQLDGMDNNDTAVYGNLVDLNVDASSEFRVITANPAAEYGRSGGMIVDLITKSGTNQFHGNAFWFGRRGGWDANSWENNFNNLPKGPYRRDQFGGSLGGPLIKDKLFFFFNTQLERIPSSALGRINTPLATYRDTITNAALRGLFDKYYPLPNQPGDPLAGTPFANVAGIYSWLSDTNVSQEQHTVKLDYILSTVHTLSLRYFLNPSRATPADALPGTKLGNFIPRGRAQSGALDWTWIISPSLVNNVKFGVNRMKYHWDRLTPDNGVDLSFSEGGTTIFAPYGGPQQYDNQFRCTGTAELKDNFTWNTGKHSIKFGVEYRRIYQNGATNFYRVPQVWFEPDPVGAVPGFGNIGAGNTLANIAAGMTTYQYIGIYGDGTQFMPGWSDYCGWRTRELDFFVQDDWKILPKLMLNLGLRYEKKPPPFEVNDLASNYDTTDLRTNGYHLPDMLNYYNPANWVSGQVGGTPIWVGSGISARPFSQYPLYHEPKKCFGPRLGFVWDPWGDGKTAIRGGYGISYDRIFDNIALWLTNGYPYSVNGYQPTRTGATDGTYSSGNAVYGRGLATPTVVRPIPAGFFVNAPVMFNVEWHQPYTQSWSLSMQREILPGQVVSIAYVGTSGVHLLGCDNPNQMEHPSGDLLVRLLADRQTAVPSNVARYSQYDSQFWRVYQIDNYPHSHYDSLQIGYNRRFMNRLQAEANYTWAKARDNSSENILSTKGSDAMASDYYNLDYDRGFSATDVRHLFNGTFIYELPFSPGKCRADGWLAKLIEGWQISGIFTARSGYPLDYKVSRDTLGTGLGSSVNIFLYPSRPDVASLIISTDKGSQSNGLYPKVGPNQGNFYFTADKINLLHPLGDYYRGTFRSPGYWNLDFSLLKEVKLPWFTSEGAKIQFRAEAFNLFNHTHFSDPDLLLGDGDRMGRTTGSYGSRQIQLGLKFIF